EREAIAREFEAWESADKPDNDPRAELDLELYDESMEIADEILADIADEWFEAEDDVVDVPAVPDGIPVADSYEEFVSLRQGEQAEAMESSIARGRELFQGKVASCSKCHGEQGKGDGQNNDYDDWTKDWTSRVGLDPKDLDTLVPLMARGAMPPKNAKPRNLSEGVFRGGESAENLYRRIVQGIEGSPMPSSTFVPGQYEKEDIWHLINFVRSLHAEPSESSEQAE
ncbi:MAG: cytochrome c, partial [Planctomycetota bacterium]